MISRAYGSRPMNCLRRLSRTHGYWAMLAFALALTVKALVPAGYMPSMSGKTLTIAMCTGAGPVTLVVPTGDGPQHAPDHKKTADHPCAFSALSGMSLAAADPVLLAEALAFAFILAILALQLPPLHRSPNLRPPLRGPPASC